MTRNISLDIIRITACIMVILMHSPMPGDGALAHGAFLSALSYLTSPCVPLFFMVSGALLLKEETREAETISWLKRRLGKVVFPTIVFSLFYIFINGSPENWGKAILSIPFSAQGHGVMWFMYALIGLYLTTPIIKPWINKAGKKEICIYLIVWGITLLFPYLGLFIGINTSNTGSFYYLSGYVGYFVLGYYLTKWTLGKIELIVLGVITIAILPLPLLNKALGWGLDFYSAFWYLSAPVCVMAIAWFCLIYHIFSGNGKSYPMIATISNLCFGIYLVHIFVMRNILWNLDIIKEISNYYLQTGVVVVGTIVISILLCWGFSLLPGGQYIIGYRKR